MKSVFLDFAEFIWPGALVYITEPRVGDFFAMPFGPRGREITAKLRALDGKRVRLSGYMARQQGPHRGYFTLTPVPLNVAEAFDALADDLAPATLFMHLPPGQANDVASHKPHLLVVTGTLGVGHQEEADRGNSIVRLQLDAPSGNRVQSCGQAPVLIFCTVFVCSDQPRTPIG